MTKHLRFLFIALLMAVWTGAWAQTTVTFTASSDKSSTASLTKDGVTLTILKGTTTSIGKLGNGTDYRIYSGNKFSVSSSAGNITKIVFNCNAENTSKKGPGNLNNPTTGKYSYSGKIGTWTSSTATNTVTFNTSQQVQATKIVVTVAPAKTSTHTTFGDNSKKKFTFVNGVLEGFPAPTATVDPAEAQSAMEYWSDNENVVKVGTDGALTFGTVFDTEAKIYAGIKDGNETYEASSDYYTVVNTSNLKDPELAFKAESYNIDVNVGKFLSADYLKNPNNVAVTYAIDPASKNVKIAANGEVTVLATGEYTITATFDGNDTYKPATAKCQLVVTDGIIETKTVTFEVGVDKGLATSSSDQGEELMTKDCIKINSGNANFSGSTKRNKSFRFYQTSTKGEGKTTFSTTLGKITKIEFIAEGSTDKFPDKFETSVGTYDKTNYVWTGEEKNVTFTATQSVWVTKIIVTIAAPQAKTYTFDETSDNNIVENYENANVTLKRSNLVTDSWNTFCVPFAISAEEIATTWGDGTELSTFDRMSGNTMYFKKVESIEAGKPYLVKPANATDGDLTFNGVQTVADAVNRVGEGEYFMVGTYNAIQLAKDGSRLFLSTNNEFKKPQQNSAKMKGMRVYFEVPANTKPAELRANIDGVETGINAINGIEGDTTAPVYNLQGQCVGNSLRSLAPGIYVQGGKKYVVK